MGIEERFLADAVTCQSQAVPTFVPNCGSEHPADRGERVATQLFVEVRNEIHVRARLQGAPATLELRELLDVVVQLPVTHNCDRPVFVVNRLVASDEVDDSKASHPQHRLRTLMTPFSVGTPMHETPKSLGHPRRRNGLVQPDESGDSTHGQSREW